MNKRYINFIVWSLILCQFLLYFPQQIFADYEIEEFKESSGVDYVAPSDQNGNFDQTPYDEKLDEPAIAAPTAEGPDPDNFNSANNPSKVAAEKFPFDKIILKSVDKRKIQQMFALISNIPDLSDPENIAELARLSGQSETNLAQMRAENPAQFYLITTQTKSKTQNDAYLKERLINDPVALADVFFSTPEVMSQELIADKASVENALDEALATQIDIRVIKTLIYLVTPKDQGGAGHWRIKVERITNNYSRENSKYQREDLAIKEENQSQNNPAAADRTVEQLRADDNASIEQLQSSLNDSSTTVADIVDQNGNRVSTAYIGNQQEDSALISSHYYGQAVDISEVDDIKCTVIGRKRIGSDDKTPQAPRPIKLQWQTNEGYAADKDNINSSFNDMFLNNSRQSLLDMLSQLNFDFESIGDLSNASMTDLLNLVGQAFVMGAINSPSGNIWKFNLSETLRKLGGVVMADNLSLPRQAFLDMDINSIDDLQTAIGRSYAENELDLPYGALKGTTRDQLLGNVGRVRILKELSLPTDILNYEIKDATDLYQRIGSRILEEDLGLATNSLYGKGSISEVEQAGGKYKLDSLLSFGSELDDRFSVPQGTFDRFKNGVISPTDLNRLVAEAHFSQFVSTYNNTTHIAGSGNTATIDLPSGQVSNLRDEVFNLPKGKVDRFFKGELTAQDYKEIGIYSISYILESNDEGRSRVSNWLNNPNPEYKTSGNVTSADDPAVTSVQEVIIPAQTYAGVIGVEVEDFYRIFGSDQAASVFSKTGRKMLTEAVKNSDYVQRQTQNAIDSMPWVQESIETYEFYKTRIDNIKKHSTELERHRNDLQKALDSIGNDLISESDKRQIMFALAGLVASSGDANPSDAEGAMLGLANQVISDSGDTSSAITKINDIIIRSTNVKIKDLTNTVNALRYEAEVIAHNAYEIVTGQVQEDFRFGDVKVGNINSSGFGLGTTSFGASDVALLLAGHISPSEFLLSMGSSQLASSLGLPQWSLKYAAAAVDALSGGNEDDIKDAFFRAIGISTLEETSELNSGTLANVNQIGKSISISRLRTLVAERSKSTQAQADAMIAESLNLKGYNLSSLMSGDFAAWSTARAKAEEFDHLNGLATGTTEKFIKGSPLGEYDTSAFSADDLRRVATKLAVSESSIQSFVAMRNGQENPAINNIYFVDQNTYQTSNSTSDQCQAQTIPPQSYVYYDQDGLHTFNSYALANEYKKAHQDRILSPIEDISNSIAFLIYREELTGNATAKTLKTSLGNGAAVKSALESFINDKTKNIAFSEDTYNLLKSLLYSTQSLSYADSDKIFSRVGSSAGVTLSPDDQFDYFKTLGYQIMKKTAANYLNQYIGLSFGSQQISPDDVYQIFNGNGMQVFAKLGGTLLDEELGVTAGTMEGIISATSSAERTCLMQQAALDYIGQKFGSNWSSLAGSLLNGLGGGRIEKLLGFPSGSFKGANLTELLSSVPIEDFAPAFQLPYTKNINEAADYALRKINSETYNQNKDKSFYEKLAIVQAYSQGLGSDGSELNVDLNEAYQAIRRELTSVALNVLPDPNLYSGDGVVGTTALQSKGDFSSYSMSEAALLWQAFVSRVTSADSALGLASGTTAQMLSGTISPDAYRSQVNNSTVTSMAGDVLANILGLTDQGINGDRINQFLNAIKGGINGSTASAVENRLTVYGFLSDVFSINLDQKAGFSNGTFASIIANPQNAWSVLLRQGALKVDAQLDLLDANGQPKPISVTNILSLFTNTTPEDEAVCDSPAVDSFSNCVNQRRLQRVSDLAKDELTNSAARVVSDWLTDITNVNFTVTTSGTTSTHSGYGVVMQWQDITSIFKGDTRPLLVIGLAKALPSIIGDNNGNLAVANQFIMEYQDIYYSVYGNTQLEDYAAQQALRYSYGVQNGSIPVNADVNVDDASQSFFNLPLDTTTTHQSVTGLTKAEIDAMYPIPAGANTDAPTAPGIFDAPTKPNPADYTFSWEYQAAMTDYNNAYKTYSDNIHQTAVANAIARGNASQAVANTKKNFRDNFQYGLMDCALYKLDHNIPTGFARAMFSGNGYNRSAAIVNYISNWLQNDPGWSSALGAALPSVFDYFQSPDPNIRGNVDQLIASAGSKVFETVDTYLIANSPNIMGITFQPGTTFALVNLIHFGNTSSAFQIAGKDSPTLDSLYNTDWMVSKVSAWADRALGFDSGTTFSIYKNIQNFRKAQKAYDVAKAAGDATKIADASQALKQARLSFYDFAFQLIFAKQIAKFEQAVGLVPGTGGMLISMLFTGFNPATFAVFIVMNLFGVYKTDVICTADGYYPAMENKPDPSRWDVANLGQFDGQKDQAREQNFIKAAQYKAATLVNDVLTMSVRSGNDNLVPVQIMTGRVEDVIPYAGPEGLVANVICPKVSAGAPSDNAVCGGGSWAGLWANPQTTAWTHIGF